MFGCHSFVRYWATRDKNLNILRKKKGIKMKQKSFFIIFKRLLSKQMKQIFLEVYFMCLLTVERTLNQWFLWNNSSCTTESRKRCVFIYSNCNPEHHPWRCSETVWKLGGFEVIQKFNAYLKNHKRKSEWVLLDMLILIRFQWLIYIYKLGFAYAFKSFCRLHTFVARYCLPF